MMKEILKGKVELFFTNRQEVKEVFAWEHDSMISVAASVLMNSGRRVDREQLKGCKQLLKAETGIFSNFRGNVELAIVSMMATSANPQEKLQKSLKYYAALKNQFMGSEYLVLAATILADTVSEGYIDMVAARAKNIYKLMKEDHPFLTSGEDSVMAAMMAVSEKAGEQALVDESEAIYQNLKQYFSTGNSVQSCAFVLALAEGSVEEKCRKLAALYDALKAAGMKYGRYYELATLAAISLLPASVETLVEEMQLVDGMMAEQKPYKGIFGLEKKTRLMHASMIVSSAYSDSGDANITAATGTIAMIAAQQAAMCAAICASSAAASSASSSN